MLKRLPLAKPKAETRWLWLGIFVAVFTIIVINDSWWRDVLGWLFPSQTEVLHPRAPLSVFVVEHLRMVLISSALSVSIGVVLGVLVTRNFGKSLYPLVGHLTSLGQTFPPVAVLALSVPALGFGLKPIVFALFLYGLFPVVSSTAVALNTVPAAVMDSARGMGMTPLQSLLNVELPLGLPVILGGVRISILVNIGTAMLGALIGAGGLGSPVVAGLVQFNPAFILEGTIPAAAMAILASELISTVERSVNWTREPLTSHA
jgi:osmoprotectant transport system permease protein